MVTKVYGSRSVNVKVYPRGPTWRRHVEQLCPRYTSEEDNDPGEVSAQSGVTLSSAEESPPTSDPPVEGPDGSTDNSSESTVPTGAVQPPSPPSDCSHTVPRRSSRIKEKRPVHYYTGRPSGRRSRYVKKSRLKGNFKAGVMTLTSEGDLEISSPEF